MIITDKETAIDKILQHEIVAIFQDSSEYVREPWAIDLYYLTLEIKTAKISLIK